MTTEAAPPPPSSSESQPPTTVAKSGSIVWRRRRAALGRAARELWSESQGKAGVITLGIAIVVALSAPYVVGRNALSVIKVGNAPSLAGPSAHYLLGTDEYGRSILAELIWGARPSLLIGFCGGLIAMVIGTGLGLTSGHFGKWIDSIIMRVDDWMLALPFLPLVIVLNTLLGKGTDITIFVLGITSWPGTTRILRAQVLSIKQRPYMERARALGAGHLHQMVKHELPNMMPLILANTTLTIAGVILSESALAFLGLGDPNEISWGTMLDNALQNGAVSNGQWGYLLAPGIAIVLIVLAFTWCGNALEKILSPRLAGR
jgi:peptide/nickel transport system permease protein